MSMQGNYLEWGNTLMALLDKIETQTTEPEVHALCQQRFEIGRQFGFTVVFTGEPGTSIEQ